MKVSAYEEILEQVGSNGRHQHLLVWLFVIPINFVISWIILAPIFFSSTPDHHCSAPPLNQSSFLQTQWQFDSYNHGNNSQELWQKIAIPKTPSNELVKCKQFNVSWEQISQLTENQLDNISMAENFEVVGCRNGYIYDTSEFTLTIPTSKDWVCGHDDMTAMWLSIGVSGNVVGTFVFNMLSDLYGRRPAISITAIMFAIFGSLRIYAHSTWLIMMSHFFASMPFATLLEISLIIVLEQVSPSWRSFITSLSFVMWTSGMSFLPLMAWLIPDWRNLCLATSLPFAIFGLCYWFLPESPSWALSKGKVSQAAVLLKKIAIRNGKKVPEKLEDKLAKIIQNETKAYSPLQLFQTKRVRYRTILITLCFVCNTMVYYGLTYNIDNMSGNQFLNFFLLSISELPANIIGWILTEYIGRRWAQVSSFMSSAFFAMLTAPLLGLDTWIIALLLTMSKLCITTSFMVIYVQAAEIYPTSHRGSGLGFSSLFSSTVAISSPYIAYTSKYYEGLPYLTLGAVATLGMIAASLLPETLGKDLPQTMEDAENFLPNEKYFSYKGKKLGKGCKWYSHTPDNQDGTENVNMYSSKETILDKKTRSNKFVNDKLMVWPSLSLDSNPIEEPQSILKQNVYDGNTSVLVER